MAAPDIKHGKEFEKEFTRVFKDQYKTRRFRMERVLDSGAAGNLVRNADADFKLMWKSDFPARPYVLYVECKASVQDKGFDRMFRSLVKSGQNASMMGARRAGAEACVFFYDMVRGYIEIWEARHINDQYHILRKPLNAMPLYRFPFNEFESMADLIAGDPQAFFSTWGKK